MSAASSSKDGTYCRYKYVCSPSKSALSSTFVICVYPIVEFSDVALPTIGFAKA